MWQLVIPFQPPTQPPTFQFKQISYAHSVLSDPVARQIYDGEGETGLELIDRFGVENALAALQAS